MRPGKLLILFCTASASARHQTETDTMLIRLLRSYLAPYRRPVAGLLALVVAGTMAALLRRA